MKKIFSLSLMATALLISGNLWAENVCKIGSTEYATLQEAISATPDGVSTAITMIANVQLEELNPSHLVGITIPAGKIITLDLNGKSISAESSGVGSKNAYLFVIESAPANTLQPGSLTIEDLQAPANPKEGTGEIRLDSKDIAAVTQVTTIRNLGILNIKSGIVKLTGSYDVFKISVAPYAIDNYCNGAKNNVVCTIEGGYIYSDYECLRSYAWNATYSPIITITGGEFYAQKGIVFTQQGLSNPSAGEYPKQTINIEGGNFVVDVQDDSGNQSLVRLYGDNSSNLHATNVNISGGICNVDALRIQINAYKGATDDDEATLERLVKSFEKEYSTVFNITGGTFASENYHIDSNILEGKQPDGSTSYAIAESVTDQTHTLPTLLEGAQYKDEPSNYLPEGQHTESEITIVPVTNNEVTDPSQLNNVDEAATIKQNVTITGTDATAYNLTVKNNAIVTVADDAILTIGQGGITVEPGSKIIVEAGGILRIGDRGFEGTGADALIVYTDLNKSGVVSISPSAYLNDAPQLTIMMASRGYTDAQGNRWQYFAIPTKDASLQIPTGVYTYMYNYDVDAQDWNRLTQKSQVNEPFRGYIMTNSSTAAGNVTYTMQGTMNGRDDAVLKMKGDASNAENWNFFGNSYLAPIDINEFLTSMVGKEDAAGAERSVNIYDATTGSYESITIGNLDEDEVKKVVPPMNAFFMNLRNAASANVLLDYSECVYGNEVTTAMYAPTRQQVKTNSMKITIAGETNTDKIRFFEGANFSDAFDNDYEATKMMNDGVNIYAELNNSKLAAVANSNLDGTQLNFQADNAVEYTMTISNNNCDGYVLVDNANGARVAMTDGATYTFVATPNSTDVNRFEIRKITSVVTGNEDAVVDGRKDGTYLVKDRLVIVKDGRAFNVLGL